MKNNHSYRLINTGIRISTRKIKWITPPKDSKAKDLDIVLPVRKNFNSLFINNLTMFLQDRDTLESDNVIAVDDWKECNQIDS